MMLNYMKSELYRIVHGRAYCSPACRAPSCWHRAYCWAGEHARLPPTPPCGSRSAPDLDAAPLSLAGLPSGCCSPR
ncbi:MAG: hypothetical protein ACLT98_07100 [Eggerthellaceae bacterium]